MLTDAAAAAAVFTVAPPPLMFAELRADAVNASSSLPMVLADAAAAAVLRDNVVYWQTKGKINNDLRRTLYIYFSPACAREAAQLGCRKRLPR